MYLLWFIPYLLKYILVAALVGGVVAVFFPPIGGGLFLLLLLGGVVAAWTDAKNKRRPHERQGEAEGFDQALRSVQHSFRQR